MGRMIDVLLTSLWWLYSTLMEGTWSSCWTVTYTCHGAWGSVFLWTLQEDCSIFTARAFSTEISRLRWSVHVWYGIQKTGEELKVYKNSKLLINLLQNCLVRCENGAFTSVVGDFGLAEKIPDYRSVHVFFFKEICYLWHIRLPVLGYICEILRF